jgi:hypothetical protein
VDWEKGRPLLGLAQSELLFSAYDPVEGHTHLFAFPRPKTMAQAFEAMASIGLGEEMVTVGSAVELGVPRQAAREGSEKS